MPQRVLLSINKAGIVDTICCSGDFPGESFSLFPPSTRDISRRRRFRGYRRRDKQKHSFRREFYSRSVCYSSCACWCTLKWKIRRNLKQEIQNLILNYNKKLLSAEKNNKKLSVAEKKFGNKVKNSDRKAFKWLKVLFRRVYPNAKKKFKTKLCAEKMNFS